jgi:hypothetical protein
MLSEEHTERDSVCVCEIETIAEEKVKGKSHGNSTGCIEVKALERSVRISS